MGKLWRGAALPEKALQALSDPDCKKYIKFADGQTFFCPSLVSLDSCILALALEEEHTRLGRALVAALWFERPVQVILCTSQAVLGIELCVYRCHIAGPLFAKMLSRVREEDPNHDMASSWELRFMRNIEAGDVSEAEMSDRALEPEYHLDYASTP